MTRPPTHDPNLDAEFDAFRSELNRGAGRISVPGWWRPLIVWILPPAVLLVMVNGLASP